MTELSDLEGWSKELAVKADAEKQEMLEIDGNRKKTGGDGK